RFRRVELALLLDPVHEADACSDERQEMCAVEPSQPRLRHVEELVGHQERLGPRPRTLRDALANRTAANGDSITLDVRRCFQCSAGKSKKVSSASASFSSVVTAFGYLAPYSAANRVIASQAIDPTGGK